MAVYTKYCKREFNLTRGCTTLLLGSPQLYRRSDPEFLESALSLMVDPDESKSLVPRLSGVAGVEVITRSGGKFGFSVEGGEVSFSGITQNRLPNFYLYCVVGRNCQCVSHPLQRLDQFVVRRRVSLPSRLPHGPSLV